MQLTDKQSNRLEAAIVRHVRDIPWDEEIPNVMWLTGLQIDDFDSRGGNEYAVWYSFEVPSNDGYDGWHLRNGRIVFTANFVQDVVEDINILY